MDNVFLDPAVALEAAAGMSDMENMMDQNEELRIAQEQANEYSAKLEDWVSFTSAKLIGVPPDCSDRHFGNCWMIGTYSDI